jgi:LPS-assembly protein
VRGTRLIGWVVSWLVMVPVVVFGQERQELRIGAEAPVNVFADRIENLERERLLIAEGRVEIEQGEVRLEADRVEVNTETGEAVAVGRVVFFDGRDRLTGERLEYNFRTGTGIVHKADALAEPHFFLRGDRMERFGEKAYRITGGWFTTCEDENPAWHVEWNRATAYLDDWVWGTGGSFWVKRIPLVPFLPIFGASLRKDRHSGLLTPSFGNSSEKGFTFRQPIYLALTDSQDLLLVPTYYGSRGLGLGAAYRYVRKETSRGEVEGFYLRDTERHEHRGVVALRHEELITPQLDLKVDVAYVSDDDWFRDFGNTLDERSRQRLESNVALTQRWPTWLLFGRFFFYEDLTTTQPVELNRLPEIRLNAFSQEVFPGSGLLFELESSYNNFVRDLGSDGQRLDLRPRLTFPYSPAGLFTVTPRVGFRETLYDTKVVGAEVDRGFLVEDTRDEFVNRTLFEGGVDLEARAFRVFDVGGALGIQKIQHAIEPRVSYNYVSDTDQDEIPQYDSVDRIVGTNNLTYSLTNRIKARGAPSDLYPAGRVWELARLTFSQSWEIVAPPELRPVGAINFPSATGVPPPPGTPVRTPNRLTDLVGDFIFEPVYGIYFRGTASFDPYEVDVRSATMDLVYQTTDVFVGVGSRHGLGGEPQFVQGEVRARLSPRWSVRFATNYDLATSSVIENRFEVYFREQCWGISAAFVDRVDEDEFHITVNLLELGQYGFGRAFVSQ